MRIDFYILSSDAPNAREQLSCRLAEKAWKAGHMVYLHAPSDERAAELDELLWTFRDGSFVPHARIDAGDTPLPPVLIGSTAAAPAAETVTDVLINLDSEVPGFYTRFQRIAEIVGAQAAGRDAGRARFRFYRDLGLEPHTHRI